MLYFFLTALLASLSLAIDPSCLRNLPASLSFVEPLDAPLEPRDIVIFSGCDSYLRRTRSYGKVTSELLTKFSNYHGYRHVFLDELPFGQNRTAGGVQFTFQWLRVFAMPALRATFPDAKYFAWMDDDILIPYAETDMLNHYVNVMERDPECELLMGGEDDPYTMCTGWFIQKNTDLIFDAWNECILEGLEDDGRFALNPLHEQDALILVMRRHGWEHTKFRRIIHREGPYNFNTYIIPVGPHHWPGTQAEDGDAFIHWLGIPFAQREGGMRRWLNKVQAWRRSVPYYCKYPVDLSGV